ncbi:MAG: hypothetical protein AAF409_06565 [Pseudomonadota bacterium]
MAEITDRESLENWLEGRPIEDARLIAARAALRVLPLLAVGTEYGDRDDQPFSTLSLPIFRALQIACVGSVWPHNANELRDIAGATDFSSFRYWVGYADIAATAAARAVAATGTDSGSAQHAITEAADADVSSTTDIWRSVDADAKLLEAGTDHTELGHTGLWHGDSASREISNQWGMFRKHLLQRPPEEGWGHWIDWYEGILRGDPGEEHLELEIALITNDKWNEGPAALNAEIARLADEAEIDEEVDQRPTAAAANEVKEVADAVAARSSEIAFSAAEKHDLIAKIIEEKRTRLPNDPEALEDAQEEIAKLEAMLPDLEQISDRAAQLPVSPTSTEVEPIVDKVLDLSAKAEEYVSIFVGRDRAPGVLDVAVIGGLTAFLIFCGAPAIASVVIASGAIAGTKLWDRIKGMMGKE